MLAGGLLLAGPSCAQEAGAADSSFVETVTPLLPKRTAGWTRTDIQVFDDPLGLEVNYEKEGRPYNLGLALGYGAVSQQQLRGFLQKMRDAERGRVETLRPAGRAFHEVRGFPNVPLGLAMFSKGLAITLMACFETRDCTVPDTDAARGELTAVFDSLDLDRLAAVMPADVLVSTDAPDGYATYAADLDGVRLALIYPDDWAVVNLHARTRFLKSIVLMRDRAAAQDRFGRSATLTPDETPRLVTPENAMLSVSMAGHGPSLEDYLTAAAQQATLNASETVQPPTETTVHGHPALTTTVRGTDADGRTAVHRRTVVSVRGTLLDVSLLRPDEGTHPKGAKAAEEALERLLDHLVVKAP